MHEVHRRLGPEAENRLAELYLQASDKRAIQVAADRIDMLLKNDAHKLGRPLDGTRYLVVPPLAVIFRVSPDDCLVEVIGVYQRP